MIKQGLSAYNKSLLLSLLSFCWLLVLYKLFLFALNAQSICMFKVPRSIIGTDIIVGMLSDVGIICKNMACTEMPVRTHANASSKAILIA